MPREKYLAIAAIIGLLVTCLAISGCMFTKVTAPLSIDPEDQYGFHIPQGSTVYHWANGITEVYGPDNKRILITKDSLVNYAHPTPQPAPGTNAPPVSPSPTSRGYQVPNGARIDHVSDSLVNIYSDDGTLILTVIEEPESYPLISLGIFYVPLPGVPRVP
jgi:hypothetical protein